MGETNGSGERKYMKRRTVDVIVRAVATGVFILSLFFNLVFLVLIILIGSFAGSARHRDLAEGAYRKVYPAEGSSISKSPRDEIALIYLTGVITETDSGGFFDLSEAPLTAVKNRLRVIRGDRKIKGVLLLIDSPGGSVSASDELYREVVSFREETGLPVVTLMKQVAASGGYYVAAATDYILAQPAALTGSIGVIMFNFNVKGLMERFGVEYIAVKSGRFKDMMSPFKQVEEADVAWMQDIVNQMFQQFIAVVERGRTNMSSEQIREIQDGKVYIAEDALELGLIDAIGYDDDAVRTLADLAGVSEPLVVEFEKQRSLREILGWMRMRLGLWAGLLLSSRERMFAEEVFRTNGVRFEDPGYSGYRLRSFILDDYRSYDHRPFDAYYLWEGALRVR
jgi:protease-4